MSDTLKSKTINGLKWSAIERFSAQGVQFVIQVFLARLLLPSDYGIIAMLTIFIAISQTFVDSGFSNALIRKLDRDEDDFTTAFIFNILVGLFFYGVLYFCSPFIADFYDIPLLSPITKFLGISVFFNSLCIVQQAILTIKIDFKTQTYVSLISVFIAGIIAIYLAYTGLGAWALAWQVVIAAFLRAVILWILVKWRPRGSFTKKSFKNLFGFGSKLLASGLINTIFNNIYLIVIGKVYSSKLLGYYSKASEFSKYPASSITSIIQRVTYPVLSEMQNDNEKLRVNYRKILRLSVFIMFPIMVGISAIADPIIRLLLTDKWAFSIPLLQILCFALMFYPIHAINLNLLQVKGRSDLFLRLEIIKKVLLTVILIITLPMGVKALCIGQVINSIICLIINTHYTSKLINVGFIKQMKDVLPTLLICLVMFGAIYLVNIFIDSTAILHVNIWKLVIDIIFGALIFVGLSYLRNAKELKDIINIIKFK
ncbi:MAG: lipopolysaccharide biosynthesis protein [Bacteroidales bacterium]